MRDNYGLIYDETCGLIYDIYTRVTEKFRASMEPFCDLKLGKYEEYM